MIAKYLTNKNGQSGYGKVFIAGFGPGDPDLLTIKALKALGMADVIFYDNLIDPEFLDRFDAEKIYVGKRKGNHSHSQDEINYLLYEAALAGKNTVRLKGGDPFIYGRGGEEFDYLRARSIEVEVIPGISAALGAAAYTGIPLTHRGKSGSVAFCAGYKEITPTIPNADTLVFYMSASTIQSVANQIIESGRDSATPVALVRNATLPDQECEITDLGSIVKGGTKLKSPLIAIIGEVVEEKNYAPFKVTINDFFRKEDNLIQRYSKATYAYY